MLDLAFVRANLPLVEEKLRCARRRYRRSCGFRRAGRRAPFRDHRSRKPSKRSAMRISQEFGRLKRAGEDVTARHAERNLKAQTEQLERPQLRRSAHARTAGGLPNLPHDSVPVGKSEHDNVCARPGASPQTLLRGQAHWELGEELGILDFGRAAKISGSRFVVHFGAGARLERALANFMLDLHIREARLCRGIATLYGEFSRRCSGPASCPSSPRTFSTATTKALRARRTSGERPLADSHGRGSGHQHFSRRDDRRDRADFFLRLYTLLPVGGGFVWQRRARHDPAASVSEGRAGEVRASGGVRRGA